MIWGKQTLMKKKKTHTLMPSSEQVTTNRWGKDESVIAVQL